MSCGMFDNAQLISLYTREQAIEDGVLIPYQFAYPACAASDSDAAGRQGEMIDCCFSLGLWEEYRYSQPRLQNLCRQGMRLLEQYDEEDGWGRKLRVISSQMWVIEDEEGLTYLRPEDY